MNKALFASPLVHPQIIDHLPISVRGFVSFSEEQPATKRKKKPRPLAPPSDWTLIFDTETTVDAAQQLRVGSYQVRCGDEKIRAGLFFDPTSLTESETKMLRRYCDDASLEYMDVARFIDEIFFGIAYDLRASIIGFNLPFDLSRLAVRHSAARIKAMRGGFTFRLSPNRHRPAVQVKHLNSRAALIQFAHPPRWRDNRRDRRIGRQPVQRRGSFIDLKTIAGALTSRSFSLASLAEFLGTRLRKTETDDHGARLSREYLEYAVRDVEVTWQCYCALRHKFDGLDLDETHMGKILSEASIGKAHLRQMGIQSFRRAQPDFPDSLTGQVMSTYFGGRSEVRWRRAIKQVLYCDFLSMYPTVCTLMGLWEFVVAQGVTWADATDATRTLVENVRVPDLQRPEIWKSFRVVVKVKPDNDVFPVRAKYDGQSNTIGLNYLSSPDGLWFTLADVLAAKILTGKAPEILEAISFAPKAPQNGLHPVSIAGNAKYRINPLKDDFFKRLIDLRSSVKARIPQAYGAERDRLDADQQALKILANSTSYGIFVELIVSELDGFEKRKCFGPGGVGFDIETNKGEEPGTYFHPLLATLITGAARLMLAIAERLVMDAGLDWAFCDTDSMAIAKPDSMGSDEFLSQAQKVCDWFSALNPYEKRGSIFKIESANYEIAGASMFRPLYCLSISSKRYALFNIGASDEIIIRKASAHGLGHLLAPYGVDDPPPSIPAPAAPLSDIGVERWQHDFWHQIIRAEIDGHGDEVDLGFHPALAGPAASRYAATTPKLLRWFRRYNQNRLYRDQVKPFNFMTAFHARPQLDATFEVEEAIGRRAPRKVQIPKPIAPYDRSTAKASRNAFDRETGGPVSGDLLQSYREALAQYHLRPESKFSNGDFVDRGHTERRHVYSTAIVHIGKEANRWEEQYFIGPDDDAEIDYGAEPTTGGWFAALNTLYEKISEREITRMLGISRTALRRAAAGKEPSRKIRMRILGARLP